MPRHLPPLNALRAFEAAGRHESFSRAATELSVSHSAISRHVRGLEDRLNTQLFRDLPRGLALSPDGAAYLAEITPALDAIADATERLTERPAGTVLINGEPLFTSKWLIPHLSDFYAAHPDVDIRLESSRALADVNRYEADVAIRFLNISGSNPDAILLSDEPLYPFAAPGLVSSPVRTAADLLAYKLLRDRANDTWAIWFDLAGGADRARLPASGWRLRSQLAYEAALAGHGVLLTSAEVTALDVAAGRLERVSDIGFRAGGYYVLFGAGAVRRKRVRLFREWLVAASAPHRKQLVG